MRINKPKLILLVEDEILIAMSEQMEIEKYGYKVILAHSGEEAIKIFHENQHIDLIIMDIDLGQGIDGTEAAEIILKEKDIPILFMSSHIEPEIVEKTEKITSYGYVVKNCSITVLDASIKMAFKLFEAKMNEKQKENELSAINKELEVNYIQLKAKERELRESEEKYRLMITNTLDTIWTTDIEFNLTFVNNAIYNSLGYTPEEFIGLNPTKFTTQKGLETIRNAAEQLVADYKNGNISQTKFELQQFRKDGTLIDVEIRTSLLFNSGKKLIGFQGRSIDITKRKQADNILSIQHTLALKLNTLTKLDEILTVCLDSAIDISDMDCGGIYIFDEKKDGFVLRKSKNLSSDFIKHTSFYPANLESSRLILKGKPIYSRHKKLGIELNSPKEKENLKAIAIIPIVFQDEVIGCFNIASHVLDKVPLKFRNALETITGQIGSILYRQIAEQKIRNLSKVVETIKQSVVISDFDGTIIYINPSLMKNGNYNDKFELIGKSIYSFTNDQGKKQLQQEIIPALLVKGSYKGELQFIKKNNSTYIGEITCSLILNDSDKPEYMVTMFTDITERKQVELALLESEQQFYAFANNLHGVTFIKDIYLKYTFINRKFEEIFNVKLEDWKGKTNCEIGFYPEDVCEKLKNNDLEVIKEKTATKVIEEMPIGDNIHSWMVIKFPLFNNNKDVIAVAGVAIDITEQNDQEKEIRKLSTVIETSNQGVVIANLNGKITYVNPKIIEIGRWDNRTELIGESIFSFTNEEGIKQLQQEIIPAILTDGEYKKELIIKRKDNSTFPAEINGTIIPDKDGNPEYMVAMFEDITERKQTENELRKLSIAVDQSPSVIAITDIKGNLEYVNPKFEELTEYTSEEAIGLNPRVLKSGKMSDEIYEELWETISSGDEWHGEFHNKKKNGEQFWEAASISPILDKKGKIINYIKVAEDITKRKQADKKIKNLLNEKEILLKEVHHRLKNNMNVVQSLLSIQSKTLKDPDAKLIFQDAINRMRTLGILYEKIYKLESYQNISIKQYFPHLADEICQIFPNYQSIRIEKQIDDFSIDSKLMLPLGVILNELLTNSMKYAFPDNQDGLIQILITKKQNQITFIYQDNGKGMPEIDNEKSKGFGFKLINLLTKQINGKCKIETNNGTKYIIEFEI